MSESVRLYLLTMAVLFVPYTMRANTPQGKTNPGQQPVEQSSALRLLSIASDKLSNEAARLQIQGRGLSNKEITRLNTLYQSVGRIRDIISSLENSSLDKDKEAAPAGSSAAGSESPDKSKESANKDPQIRNTPGH